MTKFNTKRGLIIIIALFVLQIILLPHYSYTYSIDQDIMVKVRENIKEIDLIKPVFAYYEGNNVNTANKLPVAGGREPVRVIKAVVTAYSSTADQTDSTPFITANGSHVRDGIVATNMFPFGTKVRFPDVYGDKVFSVEDRMHARFSDRFDIWMETRQEAINFGAQYLTIEVF